MRGCVSPFPASAVTRVNTDGIEPQRTQRTQRRKRYEFPQHRANSPTLCPELIGTLAVPRSRRFRIGTVGGVDGSVVQNSYNLCFSTLRSVRSLRLYAVEGNSRNSCLFLKEAGLPRLSAAFHAFPRAKYFPLSCGHRTGSRLVSTLWVSVHSTTAGPNIQSTGRVNWGPFRKRESAWPKATPSRVVKGCQGLSRQRLSGSGNLDHEPSH